MLHARKNGRSKADYYHKHLFIRVLAHCLGTGNTPANSPESSVTRLPRSASPAPMSDDEDEDEETESWEQRAKDDEDKTVYGTSTTARTTSLRNGTLRNAVKRRMGSRQDIETPLPRYAQPAQFGDRNAEVTMPIDMFIQQLIYVSQKKNKDLQSIKVIRELKKGDRVNVRIMPMYIFLFRDGMHWDSFSHK